MASWGPFEDDDNFYKIVIDTSIPRFLEDLDPTSILDFFLETELMTSTQVRDIQELPLTSEMTRVILKRVGSKGAEGYKKFKECLTRSKQEHLKNFLDDTELALEREIMAQRNLEIGSDEDRIEKYYPKLQLTAQHLIRLAKAIGDNWQLLGLALGLRQIEVDHIDADYGTACMKIYYMLHQWKNRDIAGKVTLDALVDVVKKCPKVEVNWDIFGNIRDEFCRKSNQKEVGDKSSHAAPGAFKESVAQPTPFHDKVPGEIAFDPYKLLLYNKAIRKGKETEKVLRINIIGNYGQGKTSLTRSLIGQSTEGVSSTKGIDISRYTCKRSDDGNISANHFEKDSQDIMNRLSNIPRVMPVTVDHSENTIQNIGTTSVENRSQRKHIENKENSEIEPLTSKIEQSTDIKENGNVVQSKHDRQSKNEDSEVQGIYERQLKKEDTVVLNTYEIKSKNKVSFSTEECKIFSDAMEKEEERSEQLLDIWDFGGQYIFYVTHTLFHSKNALYLLVFDLTSPLDEIVRDQNFHNETGKKDMAFFAKFWVESIDAYTGPGTQVILIGTHKDKLDNPDKWKNEYFENVRRLFDSLNGTDEILLSSHILPEDFAVDNKNSPNSGIRELLAFILKKHQELVQTVEIPSRWIQLEKALNDAREKKVVTFHDVMELDKTIKFPLDDTDQVKLFLSYHHDKGRLFYFDDGQPSDPIILDPNFLIDAFKSIITSERFVSKTDVRAEWIKLKHEGILTEKLIDKVWSQHEDFKQHKDVLLRLFSKHNILTQVMGSQSSTMTLNKETLYVVPCMLRYLEQTTDTLERFLDKKRQTQIRYILKFKKPSVVQMVFQKLTAAMFGIWQVANFCETKLFFENMCVFEVLEITEGKSTNHAVVIECVQECGSIELRLVNLSRGEFRRDVADNVRRYVESFVKVEFRRLTCPYIANDKPYSRAYRCNHDDHPAGSKSRTIKELNENGDIRCPDNYTHDNDFFRNAKEEWFIEDRDEPYYPKLQLTEQHLSLLTQAIGENWQLLGPALGVKQTEMDHIKEDHGTVCMNIYHMLSKWKKNDTAKATLDALVDVLKKCPKVKVEWDEFRNIRDEFCRKSNNIGFIQSLSNNVVSLNNNLALQCKLTRTDLPVTWQKNGEVIIPDDHIKISADGDQQVLTVEKVDHDDAGTYRCICGEAATECVVQVHGFIQSLSNNVVSLNKNLALQCKLTRTDLPVTWKKNGEVIIPDDHIKICVHGDQQVLTVDKVYYDDAGIYRCICGEAATECVVKVQDPTASLEFIEILCDTDVEPTISEREPISIASFTCVLNRNSTDVTWFKGGICIEPSDKYDIVAEGTIHKLKIKGVTEEDEDVYCVKVEGKKSMARLYVEDTEEERRLLQEYIQKTQEVGGKRWYADTRAFKEFVAQPTPFKGKMSLWADCIAQKDESAADKLIDEEILPNNEELINVCNEFGRTSVSFLKVCNKISENIRKKSDKIIDAWASYRVSDMDKNGRISSIVFVVSCKDSTYDSISVEIINYKITMRCVTDFSKESEDILACELSDVTSNEQNEQRILEMRKIISKHADKLMDDHSNVSVISPGFKRSIGYSTGHHQILDEPCIAIYVPVKGFIPIQEDALPKKIDGYYVDVLEGEFDLFTGRSNDFHDYLKMGLAIHADIKDSNGYILGGTLGGFLEHPDHGLCGVTCAHVVSSQNELVRKGSFRPEKRQVFQPIGHESMPFGNVVRIHHCVGEELSPGMEVAILQIHNRHPENGSFPIAFNCEEAGFDHDNPLTYNSGEVREASEIVPRTEVFKFGMESGITRGSFRLQGPVVRRKGEMEQGNGFGIRLKNQLEILQIGPEPFAKEGDSGSLVFVEDMNSRSVAIGIVEGGLRGRVFVTPICDILRAVSCTQIKMKQFNIRSVGNHFCPSASTSSDSGINSDQQMEVDSS